MNEESRGGRAQVSVLIPSYNHARYVAEAIKSVWNQTYENVELIVIDDGSMDDSPAIIQGLLQVSPIPMKFVRQDNAGLNKTLNRALSMASGKYVSILASDDRYLPIHSETLVKAFETAALDNLSFVYADVDLIDTNGVFLGRTQFQGKSPRSGRIFEDILLFRYYPQGSANLYLADELRRVGGFNEKYLGEGLDLYLRLTRGSNALFVDKAVSQYRVSSGTLNSATDRHIPDRLEIWFRNLDAYPKSADAQWRRRAISVLYRKFGQDYYNGRVLDEARRWFMKSLRHDPMNGETIQFVLRSLVLSLLSRIGIAR